MQRTIRLQSVGLVEGIAASDLEVGMRLVWNFGSAYDVVSIAPKGKQSLSVVERSVETGKEYTRTMRKDRTVAAYWPKSKKNA